jgi:hypothetical protein
MNRFWYRSPKFLARARVDERAAAFGGDGDGSSLLWLLSLVGLAWLAAETDLGLARRNWPVLLPVRRPDRLFPKC